MARIKVMADMDTTESRKPQDGHLSVQVSSRFRTNNLQAIRAAVLAGAAVPTVSAGAVVAAVSADLAMTAGPAMSAGSAVAAGREVPTDRSPSALATACGWSEPGTRARADAASAIGASPVPGTCAVPFPVPTTCRSRSRRSASPSGGGEPGSGWVAVVTRVRMRGTPSWSTTSHCSVSRQPVQRLRGEGPKKLDGEGRAAVLATAQELAGDALRVLAVACKHDATLEDATQPWGTERLHVLPSGGQYQWRSDGEQHMLDPQTIAAQALDVREWPVEWEGRPRDPAVDASGHVWFVGQAGDYVGWFDPQTAEFGRHPLPEGTGPHSTARTAGRVRH